MKHLIATNSVEEIATIHDTLNIATVIISNSDIILCANNKARCLFINSDNLSGSNFIDQLNSNENEKRIIRTIINNIRKDSIKQDCFQSEIDNNSYKQWNFFLTKEDITETNNIIITIQTTDISLKKTTTQINRENQEDDFEALAKNSPILIHRYRIKPKIHFSYINPASENTLGYTFEDFYSNHELLSEIIHTQDKPIFDNIINQPTKDVKKIEVRVRCKNKKHKWLEMHITPVFNNSYKFIGLDILSMDITLRKNTENILISNEQKYLSLKQQVNACILITTTDHKIISINRETEKLLDCKNETAIGKDFIKVFIPAEEQSKVNNHFKKALNENTVSSFITSIINSKSQKRSILWNVSKYYDENNNLVGIISSGIDFSERLKIEEELKNAKTKAEQSNKQKSAFLANMSHEIRTPMNGIIGFSKLLKKPNLTPEKLNSYIDIISSNSKHLLELLNDIIDISRIESDQLHLTKDMFNINTLLDEVLYNSQVYLKKGVDMYSNYQLDFDAAYIKTDETRLRQIITNLVNNAIKHTESGSIQFGYKIKKKTIEFFIKDTGIGIPKENHDKIFERFHQIDLERKNKNTSGTGLGLTISKKLVKAMGGKIWLESELNAGTKFYFTIPHKPLTENKEKKEEIQNKSFELTGKKILIAEDDEYNFLYISEILHMYDANILRAQSGTDAVSIAKDNIDIDLILMDINMPNMNGLEATKKILDFNPTIPIIAQTAYAMSNDKYACKQAGCIDYISKPIDNLELLKTITKYI